MKNFYKLIISLLVISSSVFAQENTVELKDLKTPNSPAFQILDIAPTSIEKPTNPRAFAASLLSLSNNGTSIPKNFAMEFSPFWFGNAKNRSIYNYLNLKKNT